MAGSRSLGQLTLDLVAKTGGFTGPLTKAQRNSRKIMQEIETAARKAGVGLTALGAAGAGAMAAMAVNSADTSRRMRELVRDSEAVGASAESLSTWQYVARDMGIEADKVGDIFKDVNDKVADFVRTDGGEAADIFEQLGLKAEEFIGLAPDQAILRISEAMDGLTTGEKTFFMESLADDASRLVPLLDNNAERFHELAAEGRNFGVIVTNEQAKVAQGMDEMLRRATHMAEGIKTQVGIGLAPTFEDVLEWTEDLADGFGGPEKAAQAASVAIVTAMRDSVEGISAMMDELDAAYEFYLQIRKFQAQAQAAGGTINNLLEGKDTLPKGFMEAQQYQSEIDALRNGGGWGSAAQSSLNDLLARMEESANPSPGPELNENAVAAATNLGILAMSARDVANVVEATGIVPTAMQDGVPESILGDESIRAAAEFVSETENSTRALEAFGSEAMRTVGLLSSAGAGGWGPGAMGAMEGEQDNGARSVRQRIEAGKNSSPYWLEPNPTAHGDWNAGLYNRGGQGIEALKTAQPVSAGGGLAGEGRNLGTLTLVNGEGASVTVQGNEEELQSWLVATLEDAAAGTKRG